MKKFILMLIFAMLLLSNDTANAQGWTGPQVLCLGGSFGGYYYPENDAAVNAIQQVVYESPAALYFRANLTITPEDPAMPTIVMSGYTGPTSNAFAQVSYDRSIGKIKIRWKKPGRYMLRQEYETLLGTTITPTIYGVTVCKSTVSNEWRIDGINDCPSPYTSFTVKRLGDYIPSSTGGFIGTPLNNAPITNWFLDITECDQNGNIVSGGAYWSKGWTPGELSTFNISSANCGMNFQQNKCYSVKLAVSTDCQNWTASSKVIRIKNSGAPIVTGTVSADSYGNTDGSTIATRLRRCGNLPLTFTNTTAVNNCMTTSMSFVVQKYMDITYTTTSGAASLKTLGYQNTYPFQSIQVYNTVNINQRGFYTITVKGTNNYGISTSNKTYYLQTIDLDNDDAKFKFEISTTIRDAVGYLNTTIDPFDATTPPPISIGPRYSKISFNSFGDQYIEDFKVEIYQKNLVAPIPTWELITEPGLSYCNPYPNRPGPVCATTSSINFGELFMGLPGQTKVQGYFEAIALTALPNILFYVKIIATNKCATVATKQSDFKVIRPNGCTFCRTSNPNIANNSDEDGSIDGNLSITANPNPATNNLLQFGFELNEADDNVSISVTDMAGREVEQVIVNQKYDKGFYKHDWTIPSTLANGLYLYTLRTSNGVKTGKFIKQ